MAAALMMVPTMRQTETRAGQSSKRKVRGRILTLLPERRSPTRQAFKSTPKRAGSEIGAPRCQSSRGHCQDAAATRIQTAVQWPRCRCGAINAAPVLSPAVDSRARVPEHARVAGEVDSDLPSGRATTQV